MVEKIVIITLKYAFVNLGWQMETVSFISTVKEMKHICQQLVHKMIFNNKSNYNLLHIYLYAIS